MSLNPTTQVWSPFRVCVSCLAEARAQADTVRATHVISLLDPDISPTCIPQFPSARHHVAKLFDQERVDATSHFVEVTQTLIGILGDTLSVPESRLLIHCHAGVSRSTALAYAAINMHSSVANEHEAFSTLLTITEKPLAK